MAYIVGIVSKEEKAELEARGWDIDTASYYNLVGSESRHLIDMEGKEDTFEAVVIFVDSNLFDIMSGPDWDKGKV
jgi:hypothetical protein